MTTAVEAHPVPFARLVHAQLRTWRAQRGVLWLTGLALLCGLGAVMFAVENIDGGATAATIAMAIRGAGGGFTLLWLAIGVVAGAAPFRSGWLGMVLSIAPSRLRWLAASYVSVVAWALGTTVLFGSLSLVAVSGQLGGRAAAFGALAALPSVGVQVLVSATVGFALGAAARSTAVPLMVAYVGTTVLPLLDGPTKGVTRGLDLFAARDALAGIAPAPHGAGPVVVALVLWAAVPAVLAATWLRTADLR
jgi:hypothetical protein